ncbi:MAG: hypothetical protein LLF98_02805 [Clostridium sp.]|uniref:hypothetical protein n=1 Tax=Clostridium sp. TaxID=1506 RepID=UPI0025C3A2CB|nr:hypothetical protein [Clostridium sp.]MCE5220214.1 hypothetical protein [Clostridium sp.]
MSEGFYLRCLKCGNTENIVDMNDEEAIINYPDDKGFSMSVDEDTFIKTLICNVCGNEISF